MNFDVIIRVISTDCVSCVGYNEEESTNKLKDQQNETISQGGT